MKINNNLKFFIIIFLCIIISSCSTFTLKKINTESLNKGWQIIPFYPNVVHSNLGFIANNNKLINIYIEISRFRSEFNELWMWWIPPIPLISYSNNQNNCLNNFYIMFKIANNQNAEKFLKENKIIFDTSKVFIIKNEKKI